MTELKYKIDELILLKEECKKKENEILILKETISDLKHDIMMKIDMDKILSRSGLKGQGDLGIEEFSIDIEDNICIVLAVKNINVAQLSYLQKKYGEVTIFPRSSPAEKKIYIGVMIDVRRDKEYNL